MKVSIVLLSLLLIESTICTGCKAAEKAVKAVRADADDEADETAEDIGDEDDDFSLICDNHVVPTRIKATPSVIIIGVKKGGTRALIEFLKLHPSIKAAGPEIHYFDKNYDKGQAWYVDQMKPVVLGSSEMAVEKTPGYFHTPEAPARIKDMDEGIKLLLIVRDPVRRMISDYNQFRSRSVDGGLSYPSFDELAIDAESGEVNAEYPVLQRSLYALHMRRWLSHFPRGQIHIVDGEEFIRHPWEELQRVEVFLNVSSVVTSDNFFFNGTKGFYCSRDRRSHGSWSCTKEKCLGRSKGRPKPPVLKDTVDKLEEYFKPHNREFYELVGKEFGWPAS